MNLGIFSSFKSTPRLNSQKDFLDSLNQEVNDDNIVGHFRQLREKPSLCYYGNQGFFFQFCDVAEVVIIHKMIYPDLATD
jgi:hypothetical protein